jgi:hypothetical protein
MATFLAVYLLLCLYLYLLVVIAPVGYEDEDGFHYGEKDDENYF